MTNASAGVSKVMVHSLPFFLKVSPRELLKGILGSNLICNSTTRMQTGGGRSEGERRIKREERNLEWFGVSQDEVEHEAQGVHELDEAVGSVAAFARPDVLATTHIQHQVLFIARFSSAFRQTSQLSSSSL